MMSIKIFTQYIREPGGEGHAGDGEAAAPAALVAALRAAHGLVPRDARRRHARGVTPR